MAPSPRILIVDDEDAILFAMKAYFRAKGFEVEGVQTAPAALLLLEGPRFDAVLADLRLSHGAGEDGLDVLGRARLRDPLTVTVLLTAYESPETSARAARLGVDRSLSKPLPLSELAGIVAGLVEERRGAA